MADIVSKAKRSKMMAGIKSANTKIEILIRKELFSLGFRYRRNWKKLPGKPDLFVLRYNKVIMLNGCFWHGHNCHLFKMPSSNSEFWQNKILTNKSNDFEKQNKLNELGYPVLTVWECAIRGKGKIDFDTLNNKISEWLKKGTTNFDIGGHS